MKYLILILVAFMLWIGYAVFWEEPPTPQNTSNESSDSLEKSDIEESEDEDNAIDDPSDEWAWLKKIKGKGINTRHIKDLKKKFTTKTASYLFEAADISGSGSSRNGLIPFRIGAVLYTGSPGESRLSKLVYNGFANILLIDKRKKKVALKQRVSLRKLCPS